MSHVIATGYRCIATQLIKNTGFPRKAARSGAFTLIQRFGSALNLNIHFHMLFLDGADVDRPDGSLRFRWARAPTSMELTPLTRRWRRASTGISSGRGCWNGVRRKATRLAGNSRPNR